MKGIYSKLLVAFDGSRQSKKALDTAVKMAKLDEDLEIHVVYVKKPVIVLEGYTGIYFEQRLEEPNKEAEIILNEAKNILNAVPNPVYTHIIEGDPAEEIIELAKGKNIDLILIGSRGLSGIKEFFLGSVSHGVAQRAECPVLIVK